MADEQYEWLDREAAERILRGEPVEASDEHARIQAARLARALYEAGRTESPHSAADGEMPGEAAALAAFRKARADAAKPAADGFGTVQLAPSHRRPSRAKRWSRPVRFGLVAAVAGCALGGAAVAATAGLLPSPFSGDPLPASSVTAAATPEPLESDSPAGGGAVAPPYTPGSPSSPQDSPSPSDGAGAPDPTAGGADGDSGLQGDGDKSRQQHEEWYRKTVEACRDYRSGHIDPERKRRLEAAAKGVARVDRFCDRLLGGDVQGSGDGSGASGSDSGSDDSGGGDGKPSGGSQSGSGSLPPVTWTPQPSESVPSLSGAASLSAI
ncbi:hypothetical protein FBY35_2740 [Streptomyces sp. SLBN-118]|uniref:hypothetical protein n=1 Tax=Streptomyces sp. SLBN-118 TaxID=2768454 RepID=UPI0011530826|nr:hypothetical protein [Streptomyces sp. SLBN-118]TQK52309.1 hypothetical protein FBY35_2740 [Streptomyces sp. SLBN-118]